MTAGLLAAPPAPSPPVTRLRRVCYEPPPGIDDDPPAAEPDAPAPRDRGAGAMERAAVQDAVTGIVRLALEVLDGRRPTAQLARHLDDAPMRYWRAAARQRRVRTPARVRRLVLCRPRTDVAEVTAVCEIDGRVRALAARFERAGAGAAWRGTAVRLL